MKNNIPLSNILKLYTIYTNSVVASLYDGLSPQDLGQWLKSETNNKYIVIERKFMEEAIEYIEYYRYSDQFLGHNFKERWDLKRIKEWIK